MYSKVKNFGFLFIVLAAVLWSLDGVLRAGFRDPTSDIFMNTVNLVLWEHLLGLLVLLPFFLPRVKELKQMTTRHWLAAVPVALLASVLGLIFYTSALGLVFFVPFSIVVLLQQLQPIWAIGSASLILKEKLSRSFILLALLAFVGVYFISFPNLVPNVETGGDTLTAAILAILASFCWGLGTTLGKYFLKDISFVTGTTIRFGLATVFSFLLWLISPWLIDLLPFIPSYVLQTGDLALTGAQFQALMVVVLVTGMGAMLVYYYGLKRTQAKLATIGELVWPASALIIGILGFGDLEKYTLTQILGLIILTGSIFWLTRHESQKENKGG
jgi:drug/metabolite transporter (DMT)-like permease